MWWEQGLESKSGPWARAAQILGEVKGLRVLQVQHPRKCFRGWERGHLGVEWEGEALHGLLGMRWL